MRSLFVVLLALVCLGLTDPAFGQPSPTGEVINLLTTDSLTIHAEYFPSPSPEAPLLVMLPMRGATIESYRGFIDHVREYYASDSTSPVMPQPNMLAVDLRGHGESTVRGSDTLHYGTMQRSEYSRMPEDVRQLIEYVEGKHGRSVNSHQVMIVGASIGANTALLTTAILPSVTKVVALSPGSDYFSLRPVDAFTAFGGQVLLVASRGDTYSFESCQAMATSKKAGWLFKGYPGSKHGTDLLYGDARVMDDVLNWLFATLPPSERDTVETQLPDSLSDSSSSGN